MTQKIFEGIQQPQLQWAEKWLEETKKATSMENG